VEEAVTPVHLADVPLSDTDGNQVTLGEHAADPLAIVLVRYFGCLPCQQFITEIDSSIEQFPRSSNVIAVGGSSARQARWLEDTRGVDMPLLLDPDHQVRGVAGLGELTAKQLSSGDGWKSYGRALRSGFRPQVPTADARQAPGIIILDRAFSTSWVHLGERMGDYPPLPDFIERVREFVGL
jgi:peroxiredoxin